MTHFVKKCVHGTIVEQCRCPFQSESKHVTTVPCPPWSSCKDWFEEHSGRHVGYVPYFDCPRCSRHRLDYRLYAL